MVAWQLASLSDDLAEEQRLTCFFVTLAVSALFFLFGFGFLRCHPDGISEVGGKKEDILKSLFITFRNYLLRLCNAHEIYRKTRMLSLWG